MNPYASLAAIALMVCSLQAHADTNRVRVTIVGENYCLHCSLVMEDDSEVLRRPDTCGYAINVKAAKDEEGNAIKDLEGVTLHYLSNDASKKLGMDETFTDKEVELEGVVFIEEHAIHIDEVSLHDEFADSDNFIFDPAGNKASARR
jgi:hypothetical protein